ncbi:hypothetical protein LZ30DRAFT_384162 [Colletotrichum cereale]|nr:hypothetical protein LZ30DRAFT_384162 [Colletotrichum cereale]
MLSLDRNHDTHSWPGFTSIEAWLHQINSDDEHAPYSSHLAMPYETPTKSKEATNLDPFKTPRATVQGGHFPPSSVDSSSDISSRSSATRSGTVSPTKIESSLRRAGTFPLQRTSISTLKKTADASLKALLKDLGSYEQVRGVIPSGMRDRIEQLEDITNGPYPEWYTETTAPQSVLESEYQRLAHISEKSVECMERLDYEAGWNDRVHSSLLEVALDTPARAPFPDLFFRNITASLISSAVLQQDAVLKDTKVDYGIFIRPVGPDDELSILIDDYIRANTFATMTHTTLPDKPKTPLAISIETKSLSAKLNSGSAQLALWLRAQYQHLSQFASAGGGGDSASCALPIMPVILVLGDEWRVHFARRTVDALFIHESINIGSSHTLVGCYQIIAGLRRLALWARSDYRDWWLRVLRPAPPPDS